MVNILNLAEVQEQKQIDEITKCIVDSLINEVEKSLSKTINFKTFYFTFTHSLFSKSYFLITFAGIPAATE